MKTKPRKNRQPQEILGAHGAMHIALPDGRMIAVPSGGDGPDDGPQFRASAAVLDDCLNAGERYRELRDATESNRGDNWETERRQAAQELLEFNREFDMACSIERYSMEAAAWQHALQNPPQGELRGPLAAFAPVGGIETRSPGDQVTESDAYQARNERGFAEVEVRNLLTGSSLGTSGSNLFVPVGTPYLPPQGQVQRRLFVRDLLSVQQTGLASVPYIRELNGTANELGASAVQEASAKPEVTMQFEQDDAPIRKLAAWIQATNEALDDAPTLSGYINTRLAYMVLIREEEEVLNGPDSAPRIKGIRTFDHQTQGSTEFYEGVGLSIGKIENADGDADGVVANPLDYWAAVTDRHATFFDGAPNTGGGPFAGPAPTAWGLPVVRSRAIESGKALVGAFRLGATLFEREGVTIRSTDSHASLFTSNTVVILAEERVGLAVHNENWFVELTVAAPS